MSEEDLLLTGGTIHTVSGSRVEAVVVRNERILATGSAEALARAHGPPGHTFDLGGRTLIPAFVDAHNHYSHAALGRSRSAHCWGPPLGAVRRVDDLLELLRCQPGAGWLRGWGLSDEILGRLPSRRELDEAVPDRPVFLMHWTLHEAVVNSLALELGAIGRDTPDPQGGRIGRDPSGEPNGHLVETAMAPVERLAWSEVDAEVLLEAAPGRLALGIVALGDTGTSPRAEAAYTAAAAELPLEVAMLLTSGNGILVPPRDRLRGPGAGPRSEHLRVSHLKLWLDGGREARISRHYPDTGRRKEYGLLLYTEDELREILAAAARIGLPVAMHAVGNVALEQALDALEATLRAFPQGDPQHRIEHAMLASDAQIRRLASLGVWAVIQPQFVYQMGPLLGRWADPEYGWFRFRDMADAGVRIAGSSDYPCGYVTERWESPLFAMEVAVTRATAAGVAYGPDQALSPAEYLRAATLGAAEAVGLEDRLGSIEPGKDASFAVLNQDPLGPAVEWPRLRVERTMVRGGWVEEEGRR